MADPYKVKKSKVFPDQWAVVLVKGGKEMITYKTKGAATREANRRNGEA